MVLGLILYVGSQILAAFSKHIWQLILTQGVLFGIGSGLVRAFMQQIWFQPTLSSNARSSVQALPYRHSGSLSEEH